MIFIVFFIASFLALFKFGNFKLVIILFNIGISWVLISIAFKTEEKEKNLEKEITAQVKKRIDKKVNGLNLRINNLQKELNSSEQNRLSLKNYIYEIEKKKKELEDEVKRIYTDEMLKNEQKLNKEILELNNTIKYMQHQLEKEKNNKEEKEKLIKYINIKQKKLDRLKHEEIQNIELKKKDKELRNEILCLNKKLNDLESINIENEKIIKRLNKDEKNILIDKLRKVNSISSGKNLESKFRHILSEFVIRKSNDNNFYYDVVGTKKYDIYSGTDFILHYKDKEIRIDISARDGRKKDNMEKLKEYKLFSIYKRTGNKVTRFDEDVLVYVVPHYDEEIIVEAMLDIYYNFEDSLYIFSKREDLKEIL